VPGFVRSVGFVAITPYVGGEVMRAKYWWGWQPVLIAGLGLVLGGCASTGTKVSCEGRLQPINSMSTAQVSTPAKAGPQLSAGASP